MKISPITNGYSALEKNTNFKSTIIPTKTLKKAFIRAEETNNKRFLMSIENLLNDKCKRTLELSEGIFASKDDRIYTKTTLKENDKIKEYVNFPHIFNKSTDSLIANDAILLICEATKKHIRASEYSTITKEECKEGLHSLKKQIFG